MYVYALVLIFDFGHGLDQGSKPYDSIVILRQFMVKLMKIPQSYVNALPICITCLHRRLERLEGVLAATKEAFFGSLPVDDLPDILNIRRLAVEILCERLVGVDS